MKQQKCPCSVLVTHKLEKAQSLTVGWWQEESPLRLASWRPFQDAVSVGAWICYVSLCSDEHFFPHVQVSS